MDQETLYDLMVDLHLEGARQGPGSDAETRRALELTRLDTDSALQVADIGCGTGASTLTLATALPQARITAVDLFPRFLEALADRAQMLGCADRVERCAQSMDALRFEPESLDLVWSEGAVYNMGFGAGVAAWSEFLRPGGVLAVSEITWLAPDPPAEIRDYWNAEYPEIATAPEKIAILERAGYDLQGYLVLPPACWLENYYEPTSRRLQGFLERHAGRAEAVEIAGMERQEAALYRRYQDWFSYGFYVARKR